MFERLNLGRRLVCNTHSDAETSQRHFSRLDPVRLKFVRQTFAQDSQSRTELR